MKVASFKTSKFVTVLEISGKEAKTAAGHCRFIYLGKNGYFRLSRNDEKCRKSIIKLSYRQSRGQIALLTPIIYLVKSLMHELVAFTVEINCNQAQNSKTQGRKPGTLVNLSINLDNNFR